MTQPSAVIAERVELKEKSLIRSLRLLAPSGGRIYELSVIVDPRQPWQEALSHGAPETCISFPVYDSIGRYYTLPPEGRTGLISLIVVNFGKAGCDWGRAIGWASRYRLSHSAPREVFALGRDLPTLNHDLGMPDLMYLVATQESPVFRKEETPYACSIRYSAGEREAHALPVERYGSHFDWLVFSPPSGLVIQSREKGQ